MQSAVNWFNLRIAAQRAWRPALGQFAIVLERFECMASLSRVPVK
jgi:hypothetical protein